MSRRRILGTPSPFRSRAEVATAGDPAGSLAAALAALAPTGAVAVAVCSVSHDDGCPCLTDRPMSDCTCEIVGLSVKEAATAGVVGGGESVGNDDSLNTTHPGFRERNDNERGKR